VSVVFQANAVTVVNGFTIKMIAVSKDGVKAPFIRVSTTYGSLLVDADTYLHSDPADIAAAFAKYSESIMFAVTANTDVFEQAG
jgi:hypothetical protein